MMKKIYETPKAENYIFTTQDVLAPSGENIIIDDNDKGGSKTEIGSVTIF